VSGREEAFPLTRHRKNFLPPALILLSSYLSEEGDAAPCPPSSRRWADAEERWVGDVRSPPGGAGNIKGSVAKPARWGELAFPMVSWLGIWCAACVVLRANGLPQVLPRAAMVGGDGDEVTREG